MTYRAHIQVCWRCRIWHAHFHGQACVRWAVSCTQYEYSMSNFSVIVINWASSISNLNNWINAFVIVRPIGIGLCDWRSVLLYWCWHLVMLVSSECEFTHKLDADKWYMHEMMFAWYKMITYYYLRWNTWSHSFYVYTYISIYTFVSLHQKQFR